MRTVKQVRKRMCPTVVYPDKQNYLFMEREKQRDVLSYSNIFYFNHFIFFKKFSSFQMLIDTIRTLCDIL